MVFFKYSISLLIFYLSQYLYWQRGVKISNYNCWVVNLYSILPVSASHILKPYYYVHKLLLCTINMSSLLSLNEPPFPYFWFWHILICYTHSHFSFLLMSAWCIFFHRFSFNLSKQLDLCSYFIFNQFHNPCLLIGVLRQFTFNVIIGMVGFKSTILVFVFYLSHLFFAPFFFFFSLFE